MVRLLSVARQADISVQTCDVFGVAKLYPAERAVAQLRLALQRRPPDLLVDLVAAGQLHGSTDARVN